MSVYTGTDFAEDVDELLVWLNAWADVDRRAKKTWGPWRRQVWRDGYQQAVRDIYPHVEMLHAALEHTQAATDGEDASPDGEKVR
jgi:hypothetical protein